jgi:hypothetical protein
MRSFWDRAVVREKSIMDLEAVTRLLKDLNLAMAKNEVKLLYEV